MTCKVDMDVQPSAAGGVLFLLNSLTVGGSEKKVVRIANALSRRGQAIHIVYINGPETLLDSIDDSVSVVGLCRRGGFSLPALIRLLRYISRHGIERIVTVNLHPLLYASLAVHLLFPGPDMVALVNTTAHRGARGRRFMGLYAPLLRRAERVVFGSQDQLLTWVREYGLNPHRCVCIHNGVDTAHFAPTLHTLPRDACCKRLGIQAGDFVLGTVGVMRPEKAHGDLLAAAAALQRASIALKVLLVGDGPCRADLEQYAERLGLSGTAIFHGQAHDVRPLLDVMDVFVLTSVAVETFSNAALEAMATGKSIVLSDLGGAREMIVPGESGLIYPPGNVEGLVRALRALHERKEFRERLGWKARARVIEEFSFERMLDDYQRWVVGQGVPAAAG